MNGSTWRVPTPHEVFTFLFVLVEAVRESGVCAPGSPAAHVLVMLSLALGIVGVGAAERHLSPRVRALLAERDERRRDSG